MKNKQITILLEDRLYRLVEAIAIDQKKAGKRPVLSDGVRVLMQVALDASPLLRERVVSEIVCRKCGRVCYGPYCLKCETALCACGRCIVSSTAKCLPCSFEGGEK